VKRDVEDENERRVALEWRAADVLLVGTIMSVPRSEWLGSLDV